MKYAIQLINKYTNSYPIWLGVKHDSKEEAKAYVEREICTRCNRVEYWRVEDNSYWVNKKEGFRCP